MDSLVYTDSTGIVKLLLYTVSVVLIRFAIIIANHTIVILPTVIIVHTCRNKYQLTSIALKRKLWYKLHTKGMILQQNSSPGSTVVGCQLERAQSQWCRPGEVEVGEIPA